MIDAEVADEGTKEESSTKKLPTGDNNGDGDDDYISSKHGSEDDKLYGPALPPKSNPISLEGPQIGPTSVSSAEAGRKHSRHSHSKHRKHRHSSKSRSHSRKHNSQTSSGRKEKKGKKKKVSNHQLCYEVI